MEVLQWDKVKLSRNFLVEIQEAILKIPLEFQKKGAFTIKSAYRRVS